MLLSLVNEMGSTASVVPCSMDKSCNDNTFTDSSMPPPSTTNVAVMSDEVCRLASGSLSTIFFRLMSCVPAAMLSGTVNVTLSTVPELPEKVALVIEVQRIRKAPSACNEVEIVWRLAVVRATAIM